VRDDVSQHQDPVPKEPAPPQPLPVQPPSAEPPAAPQAKRARREPKQPDSISAEEERSPDGPIRRRLEDTAQRAVSVSNPTQKGAVKKQAKTKKAPAVKKVAKAAKKAPPAKKTPAKKTPAKKSAKKARAQKLRQDSVDLGVVIDDDDDNDDGLSDVPLADPVDPDAGRKRRREEEGGTQSGAMSAERWWRTPEIFRQVLSYVPRGDLRTVCKGWVSPVRYASTLHSDAWEALSGRPDTAAALLDKFMTEVVSSLREGDDDEPLLALSLGYLRIYSEYSAEYSRAHIEGAICRGHLTKEFTDSWIESWMAKVTDRQTQLDQLDRCLDWGTAG